MFQFAPGCTINGKPIKDDEKAALNALQDSMSIASRSPNWTSAEHNGVIIEGTPEFVAMIMGSSNKMPYSENDVTENDVMENDVTEKKEPEKKKLKKQNTKEDK